MRLSLLFKVYVKSLNVIWNSVNVKVKFISFQVCLINLNDNKLNQLIILCHFMIENKSNSRICCSCFSQIKLLSEIEGLISEHFFIIY